MAPVSLNGDDFFLPTPQTSSSSSSPYSGADGVGPRTPELEIGDAPPPPPPAEISVLAAFGRASPLPEVEVEIEVEIEGPHVVPVHPTMDDLPPRPFPLAYKWMQLCRKFTGIEYLVGQSDKDDWVLFRAQGEDAERHLYDGTSRHLAVPPELNGFCRDVLRVSVEAQQHELYNVILCEITTSVFENRWTDTFGGTNWAAWCYWYIRYDVRTSHPPCDRDRIVRVLDSLYPNVEGWTFGEAFRFLHSIRHPVSRRWWFFEGNHQDVSVVE